MKGMKGMKSGLEQSEIAEQKGNDDEIPCSIESQSVIDYDATSPENKDVLTPDESKDRRLNISNDLLNFTPKPQGKEQSVIVGRRKSICREVCIGSLLALIAMISVFSCLFSLYWQKFIIGGVASKEA